VSMAILEDLIRAIELWLRIAKEQVPLLDPTLDPVLLVPVIAGSILEAVDDDGNKERVWVRMDLSGSLVPDGGGGATSGSSAAMWV
jgi:hypothetical protein